MNANKLIKNIESAQAELEQLSKYAGKIRLLKTIFSKSYGGRSKTWEDSLQEALDTLTDREKKVLELRFGILDGKMFTLEKVGSVLGVTRDRIRQIEGSAIRKLRHPSRKRVLLGESWQLAVQESKEQGTKLLKEYSETRRKTTMNFTPKVKSVYETGLPTRVVNALIKNGYEYAEQVREAKDGDLLKIRNIGKTTLCVIRKAT